MAFRIQSKEIAYSERLGAGGFGEVHKAKWNHVDAAVKRLTLQKLSESTTQEFEKEVEVHLNLRHPHIVLMYGVTSEQPYGMVMEFMENGSLDSYLQKNPPENVSWALKYKIALAVCKALSYLHKNGIIHRDLKSLNVLLNESLVAKVCDFGLAEVKVETMSRTGFNGTIQWSAPEVFKLKPVYNEKTDIYSFGIVQWELASHKYPYKGTPLLSIPSLVKDGERETFPEKTPKVFEELAKKCWDGKAENRPELDSVIMTLESLLASESQYASSYLSSSPLNQNSSDYLQPTTKSVESVGYLNPSAESTGYLNPFQPEKPLLSNPHPISIAISPTPPLALPSCAFGAAQWSKYFGDVGIEPPLPPDIHQILSASCPFWPSKKVHETHLLVLIPQTINGQSLTLKALGELVKKPLTGSAIQYRYFNIGAYTDPAAPPSHWVLMTRDVIKGSRSKSYTDQQKLLSQKGQGIYAVPTILDATVCIFMEHIRSGTRLYGDSPCTYTRCQEKYNANRQLVVGGITPGGLYVNRISDEHAESDGVGGCRKF